MSTTKSPKPTPSAAVTVPDDDVEALSAVADRPPSLTPRYRDPLSTPQCAAVTRAGDRCTRHAVLGSDFCRVHGGGVRASRLAVQERLNNAVPLAIDVLTEAMAQADWAQAIVAARTLLDRAGVGAQVTVNVNDSRERDLEKMTDDDLERRALTLLNQIRERKGLPKSVEPVLEAEVVTSDGGVNTRPDAPAGAKEPPDGRVH